MKSLKIKIIAGLLIVLGIVVVNLFNNRSRLSAGVRTEVQTSIPVMTASVNREKLTQDLSLVGTIEAYNDVAVVSETGGRVTKVMADVGDRLQPGSVIVQVDDELKRAAFATAEVNFEKAKKDLRRFQELYDEKAISDSELEGARLAYKAAEAQYIVAQRQFNDTRISSPIAGVVTSRKADIGAMVQPGMVVANVVDLSRLKVNVMVAEKDVFKLGVGDNVDITTEVYPGVTFNGKIQSISDRSDGSHTYPVEIDMANSREHPLKAGMFARVSFVSILPEENLSIPREALVGSLKQPQVFVVDGDRAHLRDIVVGAEAGTKLAVLEGLVEGEKVVFEGQNNLIDGARVSVSN